MSNVKDVKVAPVKITLSDGKERYLKFTLNALAELEDRYGTVEDAFKALETNSIKAVRTILWAGLLHEDPNITEHEVGNLIDIAYMQELMESIGGSLGQDLPAAQPAQAKVVALVAKEDQPVRTDIDPN